MAVELNVETEQVCTPTVKNTFIDFQFMPTCTEARCASVPASTRLCQGHVSIAALKSLIGSMDCDASTDVQTEASTCSECDVKTPMSDDSYCFERAESKEWPEEACGQSLWLTPPSSPVAHVERSPQLNPRANAFQPKLMKEDPAKQQGKQRFTEMINCVKRALLSSAHVAHVEVSDDPSGWFITIQPRVVDDTNCQTERLITMAQEALLQAASQSKRVFVMGYAGPKPFTEQPQGFEATLGIMESAKSACYHVFKKGFCRHGAECSKDHPSCQVPVHVLVEGVQLKSRTRFSEAFKQEVADLALAVTATLGSSSYADKVEAFKDKSSQGWSIEVTPKEEMAEHKEHLIALAKNSLFNATTSSNTAYIMGYAAKPFIAKAQGFLTMVGDMRDESRACWDFYSKGMCTRDCACRWEHPECLMPINIVVKERSSLKCSPAALEYLIGSGLFPTAR